MLTETKSQSENGFPKPIKAKCFKCRKAFWIKFVVPQRDYSKKNSWSYWVGEEKGKARKICDPCLRKFYLEERPNFLVTIRDLRKRNHLRTYIVRNII